MALHARSNGRGFDAVNHVQIEQYLPGVLDRELYSHWHPVTFQTLAIAARSYAIAEMARTKRRHFDLESTQASQVYGGTTGNRKALRAVQQTRGMVLSYDGRIVPGYYSSCSGGASQDAVAAFPDAPDIPPLRGREHGEWGRSCKYFRWGPIDRPLWLLSQRITEWGRAAGHPVGKLHRIRDIRVSGRNAVGRPSEFTITDIDGGTFKLDPEAFRVASNYTSPRLDRLPSSKKVRSSYVKVRVAGPTVRFFDGRGFGHGVGLEQYCAQAMAVKGHQAGKILEFYYPGTKLVQSY